MTAAERIEASQLDLAPKSRRLRTLMKKGLEIIEAMRLYSCAKAGGAVIHPQSIVHSLVEFRDGASWPNWAPGLKLPFRYALTYPYRAETPDQTLDCSPAAADLQRPRRGGFP